MAKEFNFDIDDLYTFREDPDVQTAKLEDKEALYNAYFDYQQVPESERVLPLELMRQDHVGFNSSGQVRENAFERSRLIRSTRDAVHAAQQAGDQDALNTALMDWVQGDKDLTAAQQQRSEKLLTAAKQADSFEQRLARYNELQYSIRQDKALGPLNQTASIPNEFSTQIGGRVTPEELKEFDRLGSELQADEKSFREIGIEPFQRDGLLERIVESPFGLRDRELRNVDFTPEFLQLSNPAQSPDLVIRDAEGNVALNPTRLLTNPDPEKEIRESDLPSLDKERLIEQLQPARDQIISQTLDAIRDTSFDAVDLVGGGIFSNKDRVDRFVSSYKLTPEDRQYIKDNIDETEMSPLSGYPDTPQGRRDYLTRERAERALVEETITNMNDDFWITEFGRRVSSSLLQGTVDLSATPINLAIEAIDTETGAGIRKVRERQAQGRSQLNQFRPVRGAVSSEILDLSEGVSGQIPLLVTTRKIGGAAGQTASRIGLNTERARQVAQAAASTYVSGVSASQMTNDLLNSGVSYEDAIKGGLITGLSEFIITQGFNKIGFGGAEGFGRQNELMKEMLRKNVSSYLGKVGVGLKAGVRGGVGEATEEFIAEFVNMLTKDQFVDTDDRSTIQERIDTAWKAAKIASVIGGLPATGSALQTRTGKQALADSFYNVTYGSRVEPDTNDIVEAVRLTQAFDAENIDNANVAPRAAEFIERIEAKYGDRAELGRLQEQRENLVNDNKSTENVDTEIADVQGRIQAAVATEMKTTANKTTDQLQALADANLTANSYREFQVEDLRTTVNPDGRVEVDETLTKEAGAATPPVEGIVETRSDEVDSPVETVNTTPPVEPDTNATKPTTTTPIDSERAGEVVPDVLDEDSDSNGDAVPSVDVSPSNTRVDNGGANTRTSSDGPVDAVREEVTTPPPARKTAAKKVTLSRRDDNESFKKEVEQARSENLINEAESRDLLRREARSPAEMRRKRDLLEQKRNRLPSKTEDKRTPVARARVDRFLNENLTPEQVTDFNTRIDEAARNAFNSPVGRAQQFGLVGNEGTTDSRQSDRVNASDQDAYLDIIRASQRVKFAQAIRRGATPEEAFDSLLQKGSFATEGFPRINDSQVSNALNTLVRERGEDVTRESEAIGERQVAEHDTSFDEGDLRSEFASIIQAAGVLQDQRIVDITNSLFNEGDVEVSEDAGIRKEVRDLNRVNGNRSRVPNGEIREDISRALQALNAAGRKDLIVELGNIMREAGLYSKKSSYGSGGRAFKTYQQADNSRALERSHNNVIFQVMNNGDPVSYVQPTNPRVREMVDAIEMLFGAEVVFFQGDPKSNLPDGYYDPASQTVFVNVDNERPLITILAHEGTHHLETQNPQLYAELRDALVDIGINSDAFRGFTQQLVSKGYNDGEFISEFIADVIGESFENNIALKRFKDLLGPKHKGVFKRFTDWFHGFVRSFNDTLRDEVDTYRASNPDDRMALDAVNNHAAAFKRIEEVLELNMMAGTVDNPITFQSPGVTDAGRYLAMVRSANGDPRPRLTSFMARKNKRPVPTSEQVSNRTINASGNFDTDRGAVNIKEMIQLASALGKTSSNPTIKAFFTGNVTYEKFENMMSLVASDDGGDAMAAIISDSIKTKFNHTDEEAAMKTEAGILAVLSEYVSRFTSPRTRNEFLDIIQRSHIGGRIQVDIARSQSSSIYAGTLSLLQNWRVENALIDLVTDAQAANAKDALRSKNDRDLVKGELDSRGGVLDKARDKVAAEMGKTQINRQQAQFEANVQKNLENMRSFNQRMLDLIRSMMGAGFQSRRRRSISSLDQIAKILEQNQRILDTAAESGDVKAMIKAQNTVSKSYESVDFSDMASRVSPDRRSDFDRNVRNIDNARREAAEQIEEGDEYYEDEFGPAANFLKSTIRGIERRRTPRRPNVLRQQLKSAFDNQVDSIIRGDIDVQTAVDNLIDMDLYETTNRELLVKAIETAVPHREALAEVDRVRKEQVAEKKRLSDEVSALKKQERELELQINADEKAIRDELRVEQNQQDADYRRELRKKRSDLEQAKSEQVRIEKQRDNAEENLRKQEDRDEQAVNRLIQDRLGEAGSILKSLKVGSFADIEGDSLINPEEAWSDLTREGQIKRILSRQGKGPFRHFNTREKAVAVVDAINADPDNATETIRRVIREGGVPRRQSFWKDFENEMKNNFTFFATRPSEKIDYVKRWISANVSDPDRAAGMVAALDKPDNTKLTDKDINDLSELVIRRYDSIVNRIATETADSFLKDFKHGKSLARMDQAKMSQLIRMRLLDASLNTDYAVGVTFGSEFAISAATQNQVSQIMERINKIETDEGGRYAQSTLLNRLRGDALNVLEKEVSNFQTSAANIIRAGMLASLYSSPSTNIGTSIMGGFTGITSIYTSEFLTRTVENFANIARRKNAPSIVDDTLDFFTTFLNAAGFRFGKLDFTTGNPFQAFYDSLVFGDSEGNYVRLDQLQREGTDKQKKDFVRNRDEMLSHAKRFIQTAVSLKDAQTRGEMTARQKVQFLKDAGLFFFSARGVVFRLMSAIDNGFINMMSNSVANFQLQSWLREGKISREQFDKVMEMATAKAGEDIQYYKSNFPEFSHGSVMNEVSKLNQRTIFQMIHDETGLDEALEGMRVSSIESVGATGSTPEQFGIASQMVDAISSFVDKKDRSYTGFGWVSQLGAIAYSALFPKLKTASTVMDYYSVYFPVWGAYKIWAIGRFNRYNFTDDQKKSMKLFEKSVMNWSKFGTTTYQRRRLMAKNAIGTGITLGLMLILKNSLDDEDRDKPIEIFLDYPDSQREQNRWNGPEQIKEYTMRINLEKLGMGFLGDRLNIPMGRGSFQNFLFPSVVAGRMMEIMDARRTKDVSKWKALTKVMSSMLNDTFSIGLPHIKGLMDANDDRGGDPVGKSVPRIAALALNPAESLENFFVRALIGNTKKTNYESSLNILPGYELYGALTTGKAVGGRVETVDAYGRTAEARGFWKSILDSVLPVNFVDGPSDEGLSTQQKALFNLHQQARYVPQTDNSPNGFIRSWEVLPEVEQGEFRARLGLPATASPLDVWSIYNQQRAQAEAEFVMRNLDKPMRPIGSGPESRNLSTRKVSERIEGLYRRYAASPDVETRDRLRDQIKQAEKNFSTLRSSATRAFNDSIGGSVQTRANKVTGRRVIESAERD